MQTAVTNEMMAAITFCAIQEDGANTTITAAEVKHLFGAKFVDDIFKKGFVTKGRVDYFVNEQRKREYFKTGK